MSLDLLRLHRDVICKKFIMLTRLFVYNHYLIRLIEDGIKGIYKYKDTDAISIQLLSQFSNITYLYPCINLDSLKLLISLYLSIVIITFTVISEVE